MIELLNTESWWSWLYFSVVIVCAGFIRGLTGFGFSAIGFFTLSFIFPPIVVVPLLYILESAASIHLLPKVRQDIPKRWLLLMTIGAFLGIPLGIWLLNDLSAASIRQITGLMVFIACGLLLLGMKHAPNKNTTQKITTKALLKGLLQLSGVILMVGVISGIANGLAAVGGMIVAVYSLATPLKMVQLRAGLIAYFLLIDVFGLLWLTSQGQLSWSLVVLGLLGLPLMLFGNHWGFYYFARVGEAQKRIIAISLLALLAVVALLT